ncbi:AraC family transcriptional regulator [Nitrospirillum sp. BR 11828]|uniref:helix-turn-helix domain-containing protein n=1 Tax=Nitrospirillum sp. BR 11828 TaxID=3104325 RepID=UPI002ACABD5E|nr:AraC family transcriptional regulator [Nitrospirillum sp. BR 11828]MDZ5649384.1 AraC family transcriptional regulator [Nitrospirillum sp. BR 11828]
MTVSSSRLVSVRRHDGPRDAWHVANLAPPPPLSGLVDGYADYRERTSFTTRRELPHAQAVLIVNLAEPIGIVGGDGRPITVRAGEGFVAGAHLAPALSRSGGAQAGMHVFLPLSSLRRLLGCPLTELVDRVVPLDAMLGPAGTRLGQALAEAPDGAGRMAILDEALTRRFAALPGLPRAQMHALALLRDRPDMDIAAIAQDIGWSAKHLAARVKDALGVGPRTYRRLLRFEALTKGLGAAPPDAGSGGWAGIAIDAGYCDQSHMIREFREFAGLTPGQYLAQSLPDGGGLVEAGMGEARIEKVN